MPTSYQAQTIHRFPYLILPNQNGLSNIQLQYPPTPLPPPYIILIKTRSGSRYTFSFWDVLAQIVVGPRFMVIKYRKRKGKERVLSTIYGKGMYSQAKVNAKILLECTGCNETAKIKYMYFEIKIYILFFL